MMRAHSNVKTPPCFTGRSRGDGHARLLVATREEVLDALRLSRGRVIIAMEFLGVVRRRMYKYLHRWDLWKELEEIRQQHAAEDAAPADAVSSTLRSLLPDGEAQPRLSGYVRRHPIWWSRRRTR